MTVESNGWPPHEGVRPLGPYGEGYCTVCHFIEALTEGGQLIEHTRGIGLVGDGTPCKGSGIRPPKRTPHASRLAAFKVDGVRAVCPVCMRQLVLGTDGRFSFHALPHTTTPCPAARRTPEEAAVIAQR
jgi:hypothetical protein